MPKGVLSAKDTQPDLVNRIYELALQGKTDEQIAESIGISRRTLAAWKVKDWAFASRLKENKELADSVVEASLYRRATGYDYEEEAATKDGVQSLAKHAPPDPTSMIFWLKNRKPTVWKDRVEFQMEPTEVLTVKTVDGKKREFKR